MHQSTITCRGLRTQLLTQRGRAARSQALLCWAVLRAWHGHLRTTQSQSPTPQSARALSSASSASLGRRRQVSTTQAATSAPAAGSARDVSIGRQAQISGLSKGTPAAATAAERQRQSSRHPERGALGGRSSTPRVASSASVPSAGSAAAGTGSIAAPAPRAIPIDAPTVHAVAERRRQLIATALLEEEAPRAALPSSRVALALPATESVAASVASARNSAAAAAAGALAGAAAAAAAAVAAAAEVDAGVRRPTASRGQSRQGQESLPWAPPRKGFPSVVDSTALAAPASARGGC